MSCARLSSKDVREKLVADWAGSMCLFFRKGGDIMWWKEAFDHFMNYGHHYVVVLEPFGICTSKEHRKFSPDRCDSIRPTEKHKCEVYGVPVKSESLSTL